MSYYGKIRHMGKRDALTLGPTFTDEASKQGASE